MQRRSPRQALPAVLTVLLLAVLTSCSGGESTPDPYAAQRDRLTQLALNLGIPSGFPGPQNTGVPLDAELTESGSVSVTEDGQVVENLDITGCISIKADDVVIRNVRITCPKTQRAIVIEGSRTGILVEDSEIDGGGSTQVAIGWSGYTLRRVNIHNVIDGPRLGSGVVVEDSWIHDMVRDGGFHSDAMQSNGGEGITIRHNTLDPTDTEDADPLNAAIQLGAENESGVLSGVLIENNYLAGGNYTVNVRDDDGVSGIVLRDNVFGGGSRYGPVIAPTARTDVDATNTLRSNGDVVEVVEP